MNEVCIVVSFHEEDARPAATASSGYFIISQDAFLCLLIMDQSRSWLFLNNIHQTIDKLSLMENIKDAEDTFMKFAHKP